MPKWAKRCPKCNRELVYTSKVGLNNSVRRNCVCYQCAPRKKKLPVPEGGWKRQCPDCGQLQIYSRKDHWKLAVKSNSKCAVCAHISYPIADKYTKLCPICRREMAYTSREIFNASIKRNKCCNSCKNKGRHPSEEIRNRMSVSHIGFKHTDAHKQKITEKGNPMYGVHRYDELAPFYGKRHTEESRRKMRVIMCQKVLQMNRGGNGRLVNVGAGEKQYFDQLERENGWFGNRQHFVSHLGYFVDYYEPYYNIVVEYDEPRHYRHGRLMAKDWVRMKQIKAYLGCEFWRYDAYRKTLIRYF